MTFQRARSEEHREIRRRAILDTASAMLEDMPVGEITLNELSRRVGLAKSAMRRYFESREAVLLDLLDVQLHRWVAEISVQLSDGDGGRARERGDRLAALVSRSMLRNSRLCDLIAAQPGVLEHNVSAEGLLRFKRSTHTSIGMFAEAVRRYLPELGEDSRSVCAMTLVVTGALWTYAHPSASALAVGEADPALAGLHLDFAADLETTLARLITGTLARRAG
ncbi:AcrR family transcriptional regulator [Kibdelosporangium banguiense]|uniref:AcrR family transcriptional regulator n=1 Tax=Kibdelosporangium banguiense TaxID=1365924 RepID=A0ABS4TX07_9PSEU|nr:TetR/AcrR family transcriptional regulator [Kibdelosporangium banguiense]MBP2328935.1 AcrR family transcriptional regulator [Kibdelosporangium banguiense]